MKHNTNSWLLNTEEDLKNNNHKEEILYNEDPSNEGYDDQWDYMYEDIEWYKQRTKIRKSEKKTNKTNRDW
jgi:hypothetical protein